METSFTNHQINLKVMQRIKDLKGFYTHAIATLIILPFLIFINLELVPQFHWFWYAILAWFIGLTIHFVNVFIISKNSFKRDWQLRKTAKLIGDNINLESEKYIQEQYFLKAKKQTKEIKGFYIHLFVNMFSLAIIIWVNLKFVSNFHFFWFVLVGMFIAMFFHWLGVFGFDFLGLGKKWEQRKIKELIKNYKA